MKRGIIGLSQPGKSTIFDALTAARGEEKGQKQTWTDNRIGTLRVIDERVETSLL